MDIALIIDAIDTETYINPTGYEAWVNAWFEDNEPNEAWSNSLGFFCVEGFNI